VDGRIRQIRGNGGQWGISLTPEMLAYQNDESLAIMLAWLRRKRIDQSNGLKKQRLKMQSNWHIKL
jgi:hypothetical protein